MNNTPEFLEQQIAIQQAKDEIVEKEYTEKNIPYIKKYDGTGEVIDKEKSYYNTSSSTRALRRGKKRINFTLFGGKLFPYLETKTKSAKRKSNWHR
jgi:hypothetical protein